MPLPDLVCVATLSTDAPCVTLPGGIKICGQQGLELGDPTSVLRGFLAQINTALAPLGPIFLIIECVLAIKDVIDAIPKLVGPPPDPKAFFDAIAKLVKLIAKLAGLAPQLSIPKMIKEILTVVLLTCLAVKLELQALILQTARVLAAATKGERPGNGKLAEVALCANTNFEAAMANLSASLRPLNNLIGVINLLLDLAQVPKDVRVPEFDHLGQDAAAALDAMNVPIELLQKVLDAIPLP